MNRRENIKKKKKKERRSDACYSVDAPSKRSAK